MLDPIDDVIWIERLSKYILRINSGRPELVDHFLRVICLATENRINASGVTRLQFGSVLDAVLLVECISGISGTTLAWEQMLTMSL
jgi:hypothetical protein